MYRPIMIQSIRAAALIKILKVRVEALMWKYSFTENNIFSVYEGIYHEGIVVYDDCSLAFSFFLSFCMLA